MAKKETTNKTETADEIFEDAATIGHTTAEKNIAAEQKENTAKPGAENVEAEVKTSDAQPELKPTGDKTPTEDVLGDDKDAQDPKKVVAAGRAEAKKNVASEKKEQPKGHKDGTTDPVAQGRATAERNHKAELEAAEKARR